MRRLDLMPEGPVARIDRALSLIRHGGGEAVARAWIAGSIPALVVLAGYWLERLEGVVELRLGLAALLIASFAARSILLARVSRHYVRGMWEALEVPDDAGQPIAIARTAFLVSLPLSLWAAFLLAVTLLGPIGVALVIPLLAMRGLHAPGWLARVACTPSAGLRALREAFSDNAHQRGEGFVVELLVSLAALGITINLLAASAFGLLLLRAFIGLDLALLDQFLSMRNTFAMLCMGLTSAVLLEPLRAALSAIVFVNFRVRREGLDVRAAIDAATEHAARRRPARTRAAAAAAWIVLGTFAWPSVGRADEPGGDLPGEHAAAGAGLGTDPSATEADLARDAEVRARAERILSGPEYREFDDRRGQGLRELIARLFADLFEQEEPSTLPSGPGGFALPMPGPGFFLVMGALLVLLIAVYLIGTRERRLPRESASETSAPKAQDPRDRAPTEWLDGAARLAAEGEHREALRALYLATLVALDRRQLLTFDPTLTNWQYLRQLRGLQLRSDFRELTRLFDHKCYGREETAEADYLAARALAERVLKTAEPHQGQAA